MYKTIRSTYKKGDFILTYSNPSIQPSREDRKVDKDNGIMYFYYSVDVLYKGKTLLSDRTHDFPKVKSLASAIDYILDDDNYMLEGEYGKEDDYHSKDYFKRMNHEEMFEMEYGYVFQAEKHVWKQFDDTEYSTRYEYKMKISIPNKVNNRWKTDYIRTSVEVNMTKDDLLKLKETAEDFIQKSIDEYNAVDLPEFLEWLEEHPEYKK